MLNTVTSIKDFVEKTLKTGAVEAVSTAVVKTLTDEIIAERTAKVIAGIRKLNQSETEHAKMKPDVVSISGDGSRNESWSVKAFEAKNKSAEYITKLKAALDDAIGNADFSKLDKVMGKVDEAKN